MIGTDGEPAAKGDDVPLPSSDDLLESAVEAARLAAVELRSAFGSALEIGIKSHGRDLVTRVDRASEQIILDALGGRWPAIGLLAEESGLVRAASDALWIVDPLDGTSNFAHGYPIFSISIACVDRDGPLVGLVLDPLRDELFTASRGGGAFLKGARLQVSATESLEEALFSTGYPYFPPEQRRLAGEVFTEVMVVAAANRRGGSAALDLAYIAAGRSEAHFELNLQPHDVAAGVLLVSEAGGRIEAMAPPGHTGWPPGFLVSNGRALHERLGELVAPPFGLRRQPLSFAGFFA